MNRHRIKMSRKLVKITLLSLGLIHFSNSMSAQDRLSYGFKAGLNSSKFGGPSLAEEKFESNIGFHLGVIFRYSITDLFGVKGEFMYSQKGGDYTYEGASPFYLQPLNASPTLLQGERRMSVKVSNAYLDFPVLFYGRFGPLEINGGINFGLLVSATGGGQLTYDSDNPPIDPFMLNLDHRYFADEARQASPIGSTMLRLENEDIAIARQIGAYYEYEEKRSNLFKRTDFGLNAGLSFFLNEGLYLGFRVNYGLTDVTNEEADITYKTFDGFSPALQNDNDNQISYQFSVGFSF